MPYSLSELGERFADLIVETRNLSGEFSDIAAAGDCSSDSLLFVSEIKHLPDDLPAAIVTNQELSTQLPNELAAIIVKDVRLAQALIKQHYDDYQAADVEWGMIHDSAVVHESAQLGANVRIGPNSVIGARVKIGDGSIVRSNCVIEHDAVVGENSVIHNLVNIGYGCTIGDRVIIRAGVMVGGEGFGFAPDAQGRYQRLPHTGSVIIGDDVQIGSNGNIDRGTYGNTEIKRGVKLDALCHVAHNVLVDEDTIMIAQSGLAGSCTIGKRVILSGHTGVLDHKRVADDVTLVHRGGVTEDITSAGMWAGTPAKPFKQYVRNLNPAKKIARLEQQLKRLLDEREG
ncbi:MAG: UDP-3-O-(3-hydroxymyristoyl)glucosamine N-acyltransferase [Gammaproteobacteria bacterium]|nr:UDP-3-O-(3-hydroxymyristoyl)glucosamine N-acyltransferase [Gammaproteobacteria bacterium]